MQYFSKKYYGVRFKQRSTYGPPKKIQLMIASHSANIITSHRVVLTPFGKIVQHSAVNEKYYQ